MDGELHGHGWRCRFWIGVVSMFLLNTAAAAAPSSICLLPALVSKSRSLMVRTSASTQADTWCARIQGGGADSNAWGPYRPEDTADREAPLRGGTLRW